VYEIDPLNHTATVILEGLWAADGLWLDQDRHLLYVGLLFTSEVIVWNISSRSVVQTIPKHIPGLLDDFCLDHSGGAIIGAAWTDDSVVMYNISTGIDALKHPPLADDMNPLTSLCCCRRVQFHIASSLLQPPNIRQVGCW
jgi:sugar lactone lactonase YvrE